MTTIDTTIDAPVDPSQLAGTSNPTFEASDEAVAGVPAIAADYYNLTEDDGWPVAGLLVMLDRHQQPVRAEVHLYDNTQGRRQDNALHNANRLLITKYWSHAEEESRIPLRVMRTKQSLDTLTVQLNVNENLNLNQPTSFAWWNRSNIFLGIVALLLVAAITFSLLVLQGRLNTPGSQSAESPAAEETTARTASTSIGEWPYDPAYDAALTGDLGGVSVIPADPIPATVAEEREQIVPPVALNSVQQSQAREEYANPFAFESNNLEPSIAAYQFELLDRALVSATALAVQEVPKPDSEFSIHWLTQGSRVELLGGPVWQEGEGDTIVWWFAKSDDGKEGWMAANGGNGLRYLEPL